MANVGNARTNAGRGSCILAKQKKAPRSLRDAFPSEYLESFARSGSVGLHFGSRIGPGLLFACDFFVGQVQQAEVKKQDADAGNGFVFRFHCCDCRVIGFGTTSILRQKPYHFFN
jgi:hypothetical protein